MYPNLLSYGVDSCSFLCCPPTGGNSNSPPAPCVSVIPMIYLYAQWWNPSKTFRTPPVTTHISLLYKSTNCITILYIIPRAGTVAPVFASTLLIIPHTLPQVLVYRRIISVVIGNCLPEVGEGLRQWQVLRIDL